MKISELAARSGETIPTLKFYLRKGLLPAGQAVGRNRAEYGEEHVSRVNLIRTLKDELQMSLERIADVLSAAKDGGEALLRSGLNAAQEARHGNKPAADPSYSRAELELLRVKENLGWQLVPNDPTLRDAATALATILRVLPTDTPSNFLEGYARAMKAIADEEIPEHFDPVGQPWEALRFAVLGTYLYEPLILALRRMAHAQRAYEVATKPRPGPA
jgi:DNA-binding transcriptional MerR regulator